MADKCDDTWIVSDTMYREKITPNFDLCNRYTCNQGPKTDANNYFKTHEKIRN